MEVNTREKDLEEAAVIIMADSLDSLDASSLKSSKIRTSVKQYEREIGFN